MSPTQFESSDLMSLLHALREGQISREGQVQLTARVIASADDRRQYVRYMLLSAGLRLGHTEFNPAHLGLPTALPVAASPRRTEVAMATAVQPRTRFSYVSIALATCAVAILFYGAFIAISWNMRATQKSLQSAEVAGAATVPSEVARLTASHNCRWDMGTTGAPQVGDSLRAESYSLVEGVAEVTFQNGVKATVWAPATFRPHDLKRMRLEVGRLLANVPRRAVGFAVDTPSATIVDLGTEFGVDVGSTGATEVEVLRGSVSMETTVKPSSTPEPTSKRLLVAGEAARVDLARSSTISSIQARPERFSATDSGKKSGAPVVATGYSSAVIRQTNPRLCWNFEDLRTLHITKDVVQGYAADGFFPADVGLAGPRASDGFPGMPADNRAVRIDGGGIACHRLKELGVTPQAYSVQLWFNSGVPFDSQPMHYLFGRASGDQQDDIRDSVGVTGAVKGNANGARLGQLVFVNAQERKGGAISVGKTVLAPDVWHHLVFVRDQSRVKVFLDAQIEIDAESEWIGGDGDRLVLGRRIEHLLNGLGLIGRIDEAAIWDRALTVQEVQETYQLGSQKSGPSSR